MKSDDRSQNRLFRELEASLIEEMLPFADKVFGEDALEAAFGLFLESDEDLEYDQDDPLNPFFLPWFVYSWHIEDESEKTSDTAPLNTTIAEAYLQEKRDQLPAQSVALIEASIRRPLSFFEIQDVVHGKSLKLKNMLNDEVLAVDEEKASTSLRKGDIIIASIMRPFEDQLRALIIGPFALKSNEKKRVMELKKDMLEGVKALDEDALFNREAFVIGLYLDIVDEMADDIDDDN